MKKKISFLILLLALVFTMTGPAWSSASTSDEEKPRDNIVTTKHTAVIQGQELAYTTDAGTMVLETGGSKCEIFFTAYTLDGVEDPSTRPITFAFNGGPGCCTMYLHAGCMGPRRLNVDEKGYATELPVKMVDNENSLLDLTDLVFIDAIGTGYSRSLEASDDPFMGYENDVRTFGDFIRQYVNRNNRWGSKKYVAGESYGTTRAVGVCKYLCDTWSMNLNGVMLISSVNDFSSVTFSEGNDIAYASYLPTYAADSWYHGLLDAQYQEMELEAFLDEVRAFVENEYVPALFRGNSLTNEEKDALAEKYAAYTGLNKDFILSSELRVSLNQFVVEIMKDKNLTVGRIDGRITGPVLSGSIEDGDADPSFVAFDLSFGDAFNNYIVNELQFNTDRPYITVSDDVNSAWSFPVLSEGGFLCQEKIVSESISKNPFLKVWVLCGYYDGATPFYGAEYTYSHVNLSDNLKDNISFTYYPCGHMVYMEKESFNKFRKDAEAWYK